MAYANSMVQLDLIEPTQYWEQAVILVRLVFNVITYSRRSSLLSAVKAKQKAKNVIKDQAELVEQSGDDFCRVFRYL